MEGVGSILLELTPFLNGKYIGLNGISLLCCFKKYSELSEERVLGDEWEVSK